MIGDLCMVSGLYIAGDLAVSSSEANSKWVRGKRGGRSHRCSRSRVHAPATACSQPATACTQPATACTQPASGCSRSRADAPRLSSGKSPARRRRRSSARRLSAHHAAVLGSVTRLPRAARTTWTAWIAWTLVHVRVCVSACVCVRVCVRGCVCMRLSYVWTRSITWRHTRARHTRARHAEEHVCM